MTLRVTFEIVPHGDEREAYPIHTLNIHNMGNTNSEDPDQYEYSFDCDGEASTETVIHFRSEGALELTRKVLDTDFFGSID
jgi:hypothetical protein